MTVTTEEHNKYIKPLIDEIRRASDEKRIRLIHEIFIGNMMVAALQHEFENDVLKTVLNRLTELKERAFEDLGMLDAVRNARNFLNEH